jgi:hypothetical protein
VTSTWSPVGLTNTVFPVGLTVTDWPAVAAGVVALGSPQGTDGGVIAGRGVGPVVGPGGEHDVAVGADCYRIGVVEAVYLRTPLHTRMDSSIWARSKEIGGARTMRSRQAPIFRSSGARTPEQLGWLVCGRTVLAKVFRLPCKSALSRVNDLG